MNPVDEKIIELSRAKIVPLLLGAGAFVALGFWMFRQDDETIRRTGGPFIFREPMIVHGIGIAAILFFGLAGLLALKKLIDKKPGLVLNSSGITDNASIAPAGFVPWSDIVGAEIYERQRQKLLMIQLRDPQKYIDRGNVLRRMLNKANEKKGVSPIGIPSVALNIEFPALLSLFYQYLRKYGAEPSGSDMRHQSSD